MKLLFDENLSRKLVLRLAELYPGSAHVGSVDLLARLHREFAATLGPPKVVWPRRWAHPNKDAEFVLRRDAIRITEFAAEAEFGILVLDW